ncbi:hypothetical protein ACFXKD_00270 [Nocardiopsis aegyptia]|uniref:hypothetical protein n=1 Tax=Nocardiopsis aegyptia TaxID=220378 RepID=UPI00366BFE6E
MDGYRVPHTVREHPASRAAGIDHPDAAPEAMASFGKLEAEQRRAEEARTWYTCAIATGHPDAAPARLFIWESD